MRFLSFLFNLFEPVFRLGQRWLGVSRLGWLFVAPNLLVIGVFTFLPILINMGVDPVWLAMLITMNLQSSFLTPPFGWALFYLKGVAPPGVNIKDIYRGVAPFIGLQLCALVLLFLYPQIALWLPKAIGW